MAEIAKSGTPSISVIDPPYTEIIGAGLTAGENVAAGDVCYIATDGHVYRASGAAANANANARGVCAVAAQSGEAITLYRNCRWQYGAGLTPGANYYLSGTVVGGLADAASTGGTKVLGFAVDATRIQFIGF